MRDGLPRGEFKEPRIKRYYLDVIIPVGVLIGAIAYVLWLLF